MNTTTLRAATLDRLADPTPGGIYTTSQLDTALADAFALVAPAFPHELAQVITVTAGDTALTLAHVIRLYLQDGRQLPQVPPDDLAQPSPAAPLRWSTAAGAVQLSRPVTTTEAGTWTAHTLELATIPTDTTTPWSLPDTLAGALTALAAAELIRTRLAFDARRGHRVDAAVRSVANDLHAEAQRIIAAHKRRARGGSLA